MTDTTFAVPADRKTPLSVFGVVGTTLKTFASAPLLFIVSALIVQIPSILMLLVAPNPTPQKMNRTGLLVVVVTYVILFLVEGALTRVAVGLLEGERVTMTEAMKTGARRYFPVLGTTLLYMIATYAGIILLLVPGLIVACMYAVAVPVCVLETKGPFGSLKRSAMLTKTMRWRVAGIFCIFVGATLLVTLPTTFLLTLRGHVMLGQSISVAVQLIYVPLATIFPAVIYVELRRLKENVGLARIFD